MSAHDHSHHGHDHGHHHPLPSDHGKAFALAIGINTLFVVIEFVYGFIANSTALMADAGHNLSDVLGLALAWGAAVLAKRAPSKDFTYGLRGTSIVAALLNALLLMLACGAIAWEAVQRFTSAPPVAGMTVSVVAGIGVAVNAFSAWLFMAGSKNDLNIRGAYQHMAADAATSLGVVLSGIVIMYTGWTWLDPAVSLIIVVMIVIGTWSLLRESVQLVLAGVPSNIDSTAVQAFGRASRRGRGARFAHLGDEHHRDGADGAPGDARPAIRGMPASMRWQTSCARISRSTIARCRSRKVRPTTAALCTRRPGLQAALRVPHSTRISSTSKIKSAFGGMLSPEPRAPYARLGGMTSVRLPPTFMPATPCSQPLMTLPAPSLKSIGVRPSSSDESNFLPCCFVANGLNSQPV